MDIETKDYLSVQLIEDWLYMFPNLSAKEVLLSRSASKKATDYWCQRYFGSDFAEERSRRQHQEAESRKKTPSSLGQYQPRFIKNDSTNSQGGYVTNQSNSFAWSTKQDVLNLIRGRPNITPNELIQRTQLGRTTIHAIIRTLRNEKLIVAKRRSALHLKAARGH